MSLAARSACAADHRIRFRIEPKAYSEALIDLAEQANISLLGVSACKGETPSGLTGSYTVEDALDRLLAHAPCGWRMVTRGAVQIEPLAHVAAESRPAQAETLVDELLVTATKRVQSVNRLASAISVIDAGQLRATGAVDPLDTTGQLAGVQATNLGPGRDKLLLRGLSDGAFTGRSRSTVGTYLDDTPINYNAPDPDLRLVDVERVEVVRGPQGALYGSGSLSGVYRIITRKPDLDRWSATAGLSSAWTDDGAPSYALDGAANLPVVKGALGVRIAGYSEIQGGYLDEAVLRRDNVNRTQRDGARLAVDLEPEGAWSATVGATLQHLKSEDAQYTTPTRAPERASAVPEKHDNNIAMLTGTIHGSLGWADLTSSTGFVRHTYSSLYDATAAVGIYTPRPYDLGVYSEKTETKMLVEDLVLASAGSQRFGWLAGLYATHMTETSPSNLTAGPARGPLPSVYSELRRDQIDELAAYGEASYDLSPRWTVALGGRLFQTHISTTSDVVSEIFPSRALARRETFSGISPKLSLQYQAGPNTLVYGVISEGYRAGGINSGGARPLSPSRETFSPDRLTNYEVGLKLRALDQRLVLRSAAFYDVWTNIQTDQFRPSGIPYTANVGDAATAGLEMELSYRWSFGLSLQANALVSQTRTSDANPDYAQRLNNGLPGVPRDAFGLVAMYEHPLAHRMTLRLVGETSYVGKSQITFDPNVPSTMGDYVRGKVGVELDGPGWSAQLFITNPGNASGNTFAFGNPFNFNQGPQVTPQRPRTLELTLARAF